MFFFKLAKLKPRRCLQAFYRVTVRLAWVKEHKQNTVNLENKRMGLYRFWKKKIQIV